MKNFVEGARFELAQFHKRNTISYRVAQLSTPYPKVSFSFGNPQNFMQRY